MNLSDLFKAEEDFQLEKRTLVVLRWIAIFGQLITVYIVYFALHFDLPLFYCSIIILIGAITNFYLHFKVKENQLNNFTSTIFLSYDLLQLALLLYLTGGITNPFTILF